MKKPERFVGYVEYDQKEIPFEYDESRYELRMYPSKEQYDDFNSPQAFFKIFESAKEHKWISIKWIQGRLSESTEDSHTGREHSDKCRTLRPQRRQ